MVPYSRVVARQAVVTHELERLLQLAATGAGAAEGRGPQGGAAGAQTVRRHIRRGVEWLRSNWDLAICPGGWIARRAFMHNVERGLKSVGEGVKWGMIFPSVAIVVAAIMSR